MISTHASYLVWAFGQQTDALFSPWVATLSHTQSSRYAPRSLGLPRLKPKESRDPEIFCDLCCQYTDCHRGICTFSAFHSFCHSFRHFHEFLLTQASAAAANRFIGINRSCGAFKIVRILIWDFDQELCMIAKPWPSCFPAFWLHQWEIQGRRSRGSNCSPKDTGGEHCSPKFRV